MSLLMRIAQQQSDDLVTKLNDLMNAGELNMYLAPSIVCAVHYLQSMHDSIIIRNSSELAHVCSCIEYLIESRDDGGIKWVFGCHLVTTNITQLMALEHVHRWNLIWNEVLKEIYLEPDDTKRRDEVIRFYTYLGGYHGDHRFGL